MEDEKFCPECGGEGMCMGTLGRLAWFRCRDCGHEFPIEVVKPKEKVENASSRKSERSA